MFKASLARFYGWSDAEISTMPHKRAIKYYKAISIIEARETLLNMNTVLYPKMKNGKDYFRKIKKEAYPTHLQPETSFEDFIKKVKNGQ